MIKSGRQITERELLKVQKGYSLETGILTIISQGNNDYEIIDNCSTSIYQGNAESTTAFANGFNNYVDYIEDEENNKMSEYKREMLCKIKDKIDKLMQRVESEENEDLLNYLAETAVVLFTGFTYSESIEGDNQVSIDTYTVTNGYQDKQTIYIKGYDEDEVYFSVLEALDNNGVCIDDEGNWTM